MPVVNGVYKHYACSDGDKPDLNNCRSVQCPSRKNCKVKGRAPKDKVVKK